MAGETRYGENTLGTSEKTAVAGTQMATQAVSGNGAGPERGCGVFFGAMSL